MVLSRPAMIRRLFGAKKTKQPERLPAPVCYPKLENSQIAVRWQGARTGGDFFEIVSLRDRMLFAMLDVAGERTPAMNMAAEIQTVFRSKCHELFDEESMNESDAMTQLVLSVNRSIIDVSGSAHFTTGFVGCYHDPIGTLSYISAGHTTAFVRHNGGISELPASGLPLGLFLHATHDAQMFVLEPGAALVLYSRGVMEAKRGKAELGVEGVRDFLQSARIDEANELCTALLNRALEHTRTGNPSNDMSALALIRNANYAVSAAQA